MGCCSSQPGQAPTGRGAFPAPLPPPMQDNMNELLNRWRHGEVNLLQRRFRLARAQSVKSTIASKIRGSVAPSSNSGTATSAGTATSTIREASFAEDGSLSPASHEGATEIDNKKPPDGGQMPGQLRVGRGVGENGEAISLGNVGGARAGMDKEAFLRVFSDVQVLPPDVQRSAFRLFDCVGRGSLDFRNFCRALALCCRGSREERLRFLFDLFSGASQPKHYGTGTDGGVREAPAASGAPAACVSEGELAALKKQLGLSPVDANHAQFLAPGGSGLLLSAYFRWAEVHVSDEALDRALRPFYLLPSPQQEKDKVLTYLMEHTVQEGRWMCLVAASWWSYWYDYAALTKEDLERVPEGMALGLCTTRGWGPRSPANGNAAGTQGETPWVAPADAAAGAQGVAVGGGLDYGVGVGVGGGVEVDGEVGGGVGVSGGNGNRVGRSLGRGEAAQGLEEELGGSCRERVVPTMLARRPHEIDNSSLQGGAEWEVAPKLVLGNDYVLLPKPLWDIMVDWYGGGPVFCRRVVRVSTPIDRLQLPERVRGDAEDAFELSPPAGSLMVDLYPLALHVSLCDSSGRPSGRERLVLTSHHVQAVEMVAEVLDTSRLHALRPSFAGPPPPTGESCAVSENGGSGSKDGSPTKANRSDRQGDVRLWVLEISPSGLTDTPRAHTTVPMPVASSLRPRFSSAGGRVSGGGDPQTAGVSRWKLVKPEEECMTLSELGLIGGEKVLLETKLPNGAWPRRRYIEEPDFRDFRENDRVDAIDYQGRWFRGQIVEVALKSSSKIVDSEGPVGKKKNNRRTRSQPGFEQAGHAGTTEVDDEQLQRTDSSDGKAKAKPKPKPSKPGGGSSLQQHDDRHDHHQHDRHDHHQQDRHDHQQDRQDQHHDRHDRQDQHRHDRREHHHHDRRASTGGEVSGRLKDGGGDVGSGGLVRRRMRVRVHFDRFAPQWDEWYDSKSLKLAPESSHTAPLVPAQPALKPREEGGNDTEADEEASPNAPRGGGGASSVNGNNNASLNSKNGPRVGGSAYPPPVARFPGDASGNNWNSRSQGMQSRNNGAGASSSADGISNYGGGALNRRSNTPGRPPLAGACGLVNVGNTCYLNSAVQCLSHTPLVRAYLLSDMWAAEVNKYNPLGTQGKLVEDFASLLKSLWSQEYLCIFPSKFKRGLIKYKPQFAGNEQQDSQEFLAEMLDALHEDVNRVIDKPYVPAPEEDDASSGRSDQELADLAWDRHVQRNRSVIVDLFQGQLKMECRCPVCNKKSVTFDPFMYLSVPIPVRNEKTLAVVMLPGIRTRDIVGSDRAGAGDDAAAEEGEAAEFRNPRRLVPVQYGIMLPRLGEVSDIKRALSGLCGIPPSALVISVLQHNQVRILADKDPLSDVREDGFVLAFAMGGGTPNKYVKRKPAATSNLPAVTPATPFKVPPLTVPLPTAALSTAPTATKPSAAKGANAAAAAAATRSQSGSDGNGVASARPGDGQAAGAGAEPTLDSMADGRPREAAQGTDAAGARVTGAAEEEGGGFGAAGRSVASGTEQGASPEELGDAGADFLSEGSEEEDYTDLDDDRPPTSVVDRRTPDERYIMSPFPSKLEEIKLGWRLDALDGQGGWYAATVVEIDPLAIVPVREGDRPFKTSLNGKADDQKRKTEYLVKVHFDNFTSKWDESYGESEWRERKLIPLYTKSRRQERVLDIPVVHLKTVRISSSGQHPNNSGKPDGSSTREGDVDGRDVKEPPGGLAKDIFGLPFLVRCPPERSARYLWRLVVQQASRFVAGSSHGRSLRTGTKDRMAKAAAVASKRPHITAAWVARAAVGLESGMTDEKLAELLPFTIKLILKQNPLAHVGSAQLMPDRWRAASSVFCPKLILALEWKDASRDYHDVLTSAFDHPSYLQLQSNKQSVHSGLTLEQCLDAYTREETLEEEDSWYCSSCRAHRRGVMKIDLWKMPDVLVIHMKRFQCSARWREKIRTLVLFPHSGLDMSGFVSSNSAHRNQAGGGQAGMVYDLFGVVNHMGGMTGGHYTACCRSSPCSKDGVEEVTGWGLEHPWLHFDDEFVEEMAPDKIVSEAAYVLFYRRRRLTPSNVINMTI